MNKLIIAGNGFDLAHGLPTSYNHFMDAFWRDLKDDFDDELVSKVVTLNLDFFKVLEYFKTVEIVDYTSFKNVIAKYEELFHNRTKFYKFHNNFFEKLNEIQSVQNWVDVENEYYKELKGISKKSASFQSDKEFKKEKLLELHKEFEQVKRLLERYLQKHVVETYKLDNPKLDPNFILTIYGEGEINKIISYIEPEIEDSTFYIVNFNYTPTFELFYSAESRYVNHIHGELNKNLVFGFGDEMDDDYKLIEDMDDNEYLRYFKSFQYVQNSNYKDILRYIDSEEFQVIIMGHSCGLSDRTLLNTIFEHDNCRSIKVFYYKYGEKEGEDNYTEVVQNISRHFNDKKLMRTKIVEKTLCEPMPQIQLPKKE